MIFTFNIMNANLDYCHKSEEDILARASSLIDKGFQDISNLSKHYQGKLEIEIKVTLVTLSNIIGLVLKTTLRLSPTFGLNAKRKILFLRKSSIELLESL